MASQHKKPKQAGLIPHERITRAILLIQGQKVMLDSDLARLYEVEIKTLNRAVKRNVNRFPADFMFQLTPEEVERLRYQFGTLKTGRGQHRKYLPFAFTEQGVAMLSSVLRSERGVRANDWTLSSFPFFLLPCTLVTRGWCVTMAHEVFLKRQ